MSLIIVTDIFGRTDQLEELGDRISKENYIILDPYNGKRYDFDNDQDAYKVFSNTTSIQEYGERLNSLLSEASGKTQLLGFSAGASAIWYFLGQDGFKETITKVSCAAGFYGSQIRHFLDLETNISFDLVLPKMEEFFDIEDIAKKLEPKNNVTLHYSEFLHGFMNPLSTHFNQDAYDKYLVWLKHWLAND